MRTLMWKEFREKRLWIVPLVISTAGVVLMGWGYTFCGNMYTYTPLIGVSALVALLMGAGTYSRELSGDTADFLYSRPVSWKRIMLAKLAVGLGIILAAAVVAAVVYRVTVPEPYLRFATVEALLRGVGIAMLVMVVPYLVASLTSVVLPGMIGGILMLIAVFTVVGIEMFLVNVGNFGRDQSNVVSVVDVPFMALISWPVALVAAGLLTARFGLTLSTGARALRYVLITLGIVAVLTPVDFMLKDKINEWLYRPQVDSFAISPTGRFVLAEMTSDPRYGGSLYLVRLSDGKRERLDSYQYGLGYWYGDRRYALMSNGSGEDVRHYRMEIAWMDRDGELERRNVELGSAWYMYLIPSYSGRYAAVDIRNRDREQWHMVKFVDVEKGELMDTPDIGTSNWRRYWVSDREFIYFDEKGVRHTVSMEKH